MNKYRISLILLGLLLLIPLNIYMWGEWIIVDLQWALFRYQQSSYGNSLILGYKDMNYIFVGQTTGLYNILATVFWTTGSILIIIGLLVIIKANLDKRSSVLKIASLFTITGGISFGLSALLRFFGGFAIPVGVPIILILGWWMYRINEDSKEPEDVPDEGLSSETT
jgi:hypothetical protein